MKRYRGKGAGVAPDECLSAAVLEGVPDAAAGVADADDANREADRVTNALNRGADEKLRAANEAADAAARAANSAMDLATGAANAARDRASRAANASAVVP